MTKDSEYTLEELERILPEKVITSWEDDETGTWVHFEEGQEPFHVRPKAETMPLNDEKDN